MSLYCGLCHTRRLIEARDGRTVRLWCGHGFERPRALREKG